MKWYNKNNYFNFVINNTKTKHISIIYQVKKKTKYDFLNIKLLSQAMKKRTKFMNQYEFTKYKINNYDAFFEINIKDQKNYILIEFSLNHILSSIIPEIDEKELKKLFLSFIEDTAFEIDELKIQIETEKLIIKDLKQNHRSYALKLSNDIIYKDEKLYMTLNEKEDYINNINVEKLETTLFKNLENPIIFEKSNIKIKNEGQVLTKQLPVDYKIKKHESLIINQNIDQSIVVLNFKINIALTREEKNTFNSLFGNGANSILFKIIREKNQLCYYVYSSIVGENLKIVTGIKKEKIGFFEKQIFEIISNIKKYCTLEILNTTKNMLKNSYLKKKEDFNFISSLIESSIYIDETYNIDEIIENIEEVKIEKIYVISENIKYINKVVIK